ncbi:MAG: CdaR family protein [Planctomycetota bacterium]|nr:CdaR family protein [Planctomycetota bacterium]
MRWLWRLVSHNFILKAVSLVLALFIWAYVNSERSQVTEIPVNIALVTPPDTILMSKEIHTVSIRVKGPSDLIQKLPRPIEVIHRCDLEANNVQVKAQELNLPDGVKLLSSIPAFECITDRRVTVSLPVEVKIVDSPPDGYEISDISFTPQTVSIAGPASDLEDTQKVMTTEISVAGRISPFETVVMLSPPVNSEYIKIENKPVKVKIAITPVKGTKQFVVPVRIMEEEGFPFLVKSISKRKVSITISGGLPQLEKLSSEDIIVLLDVSFLNSRGDHTEIATRVILPHGFSLVGDPPRIDVRLVKKLDSQVPNGD